MKTMESKYYVKIETKPQENFSKVIRMPRIFPKSTRYPLPIIVFRIFKPILLKIHNSFYQKPQHTLSSLNYSLLLGKT